MGRLLPPLSGPHKIIRVGLNYASHAAEADVDVPERPLLFGKVWHTVIGPGAEIRMPYEDCHLDYEASWRLSSAIRLGGCPPTRRSGAWRLHVLQRRLRSSRSTRRRPVVPGQDLPAFALLGPLIVTMGRAGGPQDLEISCRVNGR
jgi:2-keto-4-pentenoate hydratase/2-oxohepta-3-ene-1,7-dioic acid hydratase in catechol pathway